MRRFGQRTVVSGALAAAAAMAVAAVGCGDDTPAKPPHNKVIQGPVQPAPTGNGSGRPFGISP